MKERNKAIPVVYLFFIEDKKIFLGLRQNTEFQSGKYSVPSGHVERGESPRAAAVREAREEVDVEIKEEDLEPAVFSYRLDHDGAGDRVGFYFNVKKYTGVLRNAEPDKCAHVIWADIDNLPPNMTPQVRKALWSMEKGISYIELDEKFMLENP